jgi:hypothetical protein
VTYLLFVLVLDFTDVIAVNLDHPERNREVMVFTVNDVQNQGNMYNCFTIMLRIDPRDAAVTDRCTAYVVSETELLISYPALEFFSLRIALNAMNAFKLARTMILKCSWHKTFALMMCVARRNVL